jgi:two-component system response regulator AgrA
MSDVDSSRQITLKRSNSLHTVKLNDILYIETRPGFRLLYCALKDGSVLEFHDTMKNVMKNLDSRFFHCHRSFIINIHQIRKLENDKQYYSVTMNDGKICDVSKPNWKELIGRVKD